LKAIFEGIVLSVLFYFPRPPFTALFAKPIKNIFGAAYLHYPYNFNILPTLFYYGQVIVMILFGVIMYGMAVAMVSQAHSEGEGVRAFGSFNRAARRYFALLGIWAIIYILSFVILKAPTWIVTSTMQRTPSSVMLLQVLSYAGIAVAFLVEALFIYAYPAMIIERRGVFGAIARSFGVVKHVFFATIVLVFIPRLLEVLFMLVKQKQQGLMNLTFPEITLYILAAGIIISFVTDSLVFLSTANLFILKQETEKESK
ncbi:MAG TPA: hypothetical protein P5521_05610, partial [Candidatus Omnitrophota bacterium]|nr:hypothetical protein [Candidatus Omnitrophota bacterium]